MTSTLRIGDLRRHGYSNNQVVKVIDGGLGQKKPTLTIGRKQEGSG